MARTIVFKSSNDVIEVSQKPLKVGIRDVSWTHLVVGEDDIKSFIKQEFKKVRSFQEDLVEEQRPRLTSHKDFSVIVFSVPSRSIFDADDSGEPVLQVSFIIKGNRLVSIVDKRFIIIDRIMDTVLKKSWKEVHVTAVLSYLMEEIIEKAIDIIEQLEKKIDIMQKDMIQGKNPRRILQKVEGMKENLYYTNKMLRADLEVIREIIAGKGRFVDLRYFSAHTEDRLLYSIDILDTARESLNGLNSLYLGVVSHRLNEHIYKLTIVGAMLLIPTIIAGFWGMNVALPFKNFWGLVVVSFGLSIIFALVLVIMRRS
jgi:magnesium transporter